MGGLRSNVILSSGYLLYPAVGGLEMKKMNVRLAICASALALLMAGPALAEGDNANGGNGNHYGWDKGNSGGGVSHSAPGPELGVGLLPALIIGGYLWYRRRSKQRDQ